MKLRDDYGLTGCGLVALMVALLLLVVVAGGVAIAVVTRASCDERWADWTHRWEVIGGCIIEYEGRWYPEAAVRTLLVDR